MIYGKAYDETDPISIERYAQGLIGKTFGQVCDEDDKKKGFMLVKEEVAPYGYAQKHENKKRKGGLGEIIEERYFHYAANNDSRPDFPEAGVELKVTPYRKNKNGTLSAKERLIITMIDYMNVVNEPFYDSHLWGKANLILLVYYLYMEGIKNRLDYRIDYARLFSPPKEDIKIIEADYNFIVNKIRQGKAHELSEADTMYLGAAPKAATSADRRQQPFSSEMAKPRAFAFKNSYMTYVLNHYIVPGKRTYEPILTSATEETFEQYVTNKIGAYKGKSVEELCVTFDIETRPKDLGALIAYRILGIKGNHAEEFEKANIVVKTIRIGANNKIKESMSFPNFKFKELVQEEWDDSVFGTYLRETRFLFVVYKFNDNGELILKGSKFWNIPYHDLEFEVKSVWERTKKVLIEGVQLRYNGNCTTNNFPKATENPVCHVRPHGKNAKDTYELPDGRQYTKQCFWLNNTYILSQMDAEFFE